MECYVEKRRPHFDVAHRVHLILLGYLPDEFGWTSTQFNRNLKSKDHVDYNNLGESMIYQSGHGAFQWLRV